MRRSGASETFSGGAWTSFGRKDKFKTVLIGEENGGYRAVGRADCLLSLLEAAALVKKLEERLGVSAAAAAPVVVAAAGRGGSGG